MKMKKKTLDIIVEVVDEWVCKDDYEKRDYER